MTIYKSIQSTIILSLLVIFSQTFADVHNVPDDFETIQDAIEEAGELAEKAADVVEDIKEIAKDAKKLSNGMQALQPYIPYLGIVLAFIAGAWIF